jgi:hypothetical protein
MGLAMTPSMAKSSTVFTVVAVISLGATIASTGFGRGAHARFDQAKARVEAQGGVAANPPGGGRYPGVIPSFRLGQADIEQARVHTNAGRRAEAATSLVRVLDRAKEIDQQGSTLIASIVASKLVDGALDRIDADPSLVDDPALAAALRRTTLPSSRRPLASERLHALAVLATIPGQVPLRSGGLVEKATTDAMRDVEGTLGEMENALLAGDVKRCERAALTSRGLAQQVTVGPGICKQAETVVATGQRLERVRARARARG